MILENFRASSQDEKVSLGGKTVSMNDSLKKDPGVVLLGTSGGHSFKHKEPFL
jgi:hypothetical protein